jgi:thiol-disulfide isomerase/thioredoxin
MKTRKHGKGGSGKFLRVDSAKDIKKFEEFLKKSPITITMVYLGWCGHCKKAEPTFREVAKNNYPGVNFAMLNGDIQNQTSIKSVEVQGVPAFVVNARNGTMNSAAEVPISYDKNSVERLANASVQTVRSAGNGNGSINPRTINANMTNGSAKPPPFLAINAPKAKGTVGAAAEEEDEPINAVNGMEDDTEDELEFENEAEEPTTVGATSFNMNRTLPTPSASLIANAQRERRRANLIKPADSFAEEPNIISPMNATSPSAVTARLMVEEGVEDKLKRPMMIGGSYRTFSNMSSKITVDNLSITQKKTKEGSFKYYYKGTHKGMNGNKITINDSDNNLMALVNRVKDRIVQLQGS